MALFFQFLNDGLDVLTRPCSDRRTQVLVRKSIEARCKDTIERIHHDFDRILHCIMEFFFDDLFVFSCLFDFGFVFIALIHQILEEGWNQSFAMFCTPEHGFSWRNVSWIIFSRLFGMRRINSSRIADVVTDHDARIHALEIQNCNPRMQSCFNIVNVSTSNLPFLGFSTSCQWYGDLLAVCKSNHETVKQLRCAPIGGCFKRNLRNSSDRFLATNRLNSMENVER